jgi:hypothetical protein
VSWGVALALFVVVAAAYRASPRRDMLDAKYALLTAESLLSAGSWNLAPYVPGGVALMSRPDQARAHWQLRVVGDRLVYYYPPGTPLLAAVPLALLRLDGATTLDARGRHSDRRELRLQALIAALFGGAAVTLAFFLARRELPLLPAVLVALAAAFGTGYWSVVSRGLWSHTGTVVVLSAALLELLRWEDGERPRPAVLGALLVAAFWTRPTSAFAVVAFVVVVALRYRRALPWLIATGAAGVVLYVGWSRVVWTTWLPSYSRNIVSRGKPDPLAAFLGQLFSAEHGLLVFSPVLLVIFWVLARRGIAPDRRGTAAVSIAVVAVYLAFHCSRVRWWGAGSNGPRFLCDVTPFLVWLGAHAWRRARAGMPTATPAESPARSSVGAPSGAVRVALARVTVALLVLAGIAAHATGALRIPAIALGRKAMDRHGGYVAPLGSADYWRRLPQVGVTRLLVARLAAKADVKGAPGGARRGSGTRRGD